MSALYNTIGDGYDVTRAADPGIAATIRRLLSPEASGRYLDVGCGTGNYTVLMDAFGGSWCGVDVSKRMLREAQEKSETVEWVEADVESLPWDSGTFDGAICTLATHHFADLPRACSEIGRVLKPGSPLVLFTTTPEQTSSYWLRHYFPRMIQRSSDQLTDLNTLRRALQIGGFDDVDTEPYSVPEDLRDHFLYSGKHHPERYLSTEFRRGISSFAKLVDSEELEHGLAELRKDIDSGAIDRIRDEHPGNHGDYLFIRARKN